MQQDNLEIDNYPEIYQRYLSKEINAVVGFLENSGKVLDVGCGTGRIIPIVSPLVEEYTGIDIKPDYIKTAKKLTKEHDNVQIEKLDALELSKKFKENTFDKSICIWNTIGCVKDDKLVIQEIAKVTKKEFFFSVIAKGTLELRKEYYEKLNIDYEIDKEKEEIHSKEWCISKAYSREDILKLVEGTGFKIKTIDKVENFAYFVTCIK